MEEEEEEGKKKRRRRREERGEARRGEGGVVIVVDLISFEKCKCEILFSRNLDIIKDVSNQSLIEFI